MTTFTRPLLIAAQLVIAAAAIAAAGCGAGNNSAPVVVAPGSLGTFTSPPVDGLTATFNVAPGAPLGTTVTVTSSATAPSGVPAPSTIARQTQSIAGAVSFLYVSIELSQAVPASLFTSEVLALTNAFSTSASYYVEIDDPSATLPKLTTVSGTTSGSAVTFTNANGSNGNGIETFEADHVYVFQFYYVSAPSQSPTPSPSPNVGGLVDIAIPTPAPVICSPAPATVAVGSRIAIDCTSQGYGGLFDWTVSDPTVADIQLASESYDFFYVTGLETGATTLSVQVPGAGTSGTGTVLITVTPAIP